MNAQAQRLALILQAIEDAEREMADYRAEHKSRLERLQKQAWQLRNEILGGQMPLEGEPPAPQPEA